MFSSTEERVNDGGCDHVICGRPLNWTRAKPMQVFYSRYLIKLDNCQILKASASSMKPDQLKLDDAHNCRVVALPKAFTSWRLSASPPLSIWISWPGIFISNDDFTAAFDHTSYLSFLLHRQECWVHFCSTQKCINRDKTDIASKQHKSQKDSIHFKCVMWSNSECVMIQISHVEQFLIA